MMKLFGTDGIRAPFGTYPLDPETILHLGFCLGRKLASEGPTPTVVIGGDTRASTHEICNWLATGLRTAEVEVRFGGVLPTPAIASLVIDTQSSSGIAVSASHNPFPDNGIKLFDAHGFKWTPAAEAELEELVSGTASGLPSEPVELEIDPALSDRYIGSLRNRLGEARPFADLRIVLDTANGAATPFAGELFRHLGADVIGVGDRPDGTNINRRCGSTAPEAMQAAVIDARADFGVAFDGDADRALLADEKGQMRDGDAMLYLWARYLSQRGELEPAAIVATSMSNLGLEHALAATGITIVRCDVGDRNVVTAMQEHGIALGGEQSGHLVYLRSATTGDGLSTALQMARIIHESDGTLAEQLEGFRRFPQVLKNVRVAEKPPLESLPSVTRAAHEVEEILGTRGRLVLRYSGTEPLARVMIEGPEQNEIEEMADRLIESLRAEIGDGELQGGADS